MIKNGMAAVGLALVANLAHADNYFSPNEERVRLSLGVTHVSNATELRLDQSQTTPGTAINAEKTFALDATDFEPKFDAVVRVAARHRLRFDYFGLDRTGHTTVGTPIIFKDVILQRGDPLESDLSLRALSITYAYSFVHNSRFEAAGTFSINETDISARARVITQTRHVIQSKDMAGPFPTFGLDATYVISKRFYCDARAQYFKVAVDHLDGSLGIYEFDALYRFRPNISLAVGFNAVKMHLASRQRVDSGRFDLSTRGPLLFVRVVF